MIALYLSISINLSMSLGIFEEALLRYLLYLAIRLRGQPSSKSGEAPSERRVDGDLDIAFARGRRGSRELALDVQGG